MTEDQLYQEIFARLPPPPREVAVPPGDDCAGLRIGSGLILLLAVDQTIGGRHYCETGPAAASPSQAARKLLARNLSDIAAMGGTPRHALTAIAQSSGPDWLRAFYDGLLAMARKHGIHLIGGDLGTSFKENICSLTIVGYVPERFLVRRSGAEAGDRLFGTGAFGQSLATGHHMNFTPRYREGRWLAERKFAKAMIDVSDGLLLDAQRLCSASGIGLEINPELVPRRTKQTSIEQALRDGEDYELLFAAAEDQAGALQENWPFPDVRLTEIGVFKAADTPIITRPDNVPFDMAAAGYDHINRT